MSLGVLPAGTGIFDQRSAAGAWPPPQAACRHAVPVVFAGSELTIAVVVDRFGLLGLSKQHIGAPRIIGLVFLLVGVVLVVRR